MEGLYVHRNINKSLGSQQSHFHNGYYEIYYLKRGTVRYIISDKIFELSKNDVALIPKGVIHNTSYSELENERLLLNFSKEYLSDTSLLESFDNGVISLTEKEGFDFENILKKIEREISSEDAFSKKLVTQYITEILILFMRKENRDRKAELEGYNKIMQTAAEYINSSFDTDISLAALSKKFSLSQSFFSRKFKEITGFGVAEYITLVRIKRAEKLLRDTNLSMTDVAYSCGFSDSSYFAATFKKLIGMTPLKYSKRYK